MSEPESHPPSSDPLVLPPWDPAWSETPLCEEWNARIADLEFDLLRTGPLSAVDNLALDATLLYRVARGERRPLLWLWDWAESAVILGSYQSVMNETDGEACARRGFAVARRISGGGAMVVEPGRTLTWSLILPESVVADLSPVQSFAFLDRWAVRTLRALHIPATYRPINDITSPVAKMGGAAQCRRSRTVLHHVTMAYDLDRDTLYDVLRLGRPALSDKGIPSAQKDVSPLADFTSLSLPALRNRMAESFALQFRTHESEIQDADREQADRRARETFRDPSWVFRVP